MEEEPVRGNKFIISEVRIGDYWEGGRAVELRFWDQTTDKTQYNAKIIVDKATAARLINQLRRALDDDYNRVINEREN